MRTNGAGRCFLDGLMGQEVLVLCNLSFGGTLSTLYISPWISLVGRRRIGRREWFMVFLFRIGIQNIILGVPHDSAA